MNIKYFDHAATTSVNEDVLKEMIPYFKMNFGNASSMYSIGRRSKKAIEDSREKIAKAINCKNANEIYFTACGSESDNLAIKGIAYANKDKGNHIITSKIEHPAVLNTCKSLEKDGFKVTYLNVNEKGFINLEELKNSINDNTILITIMFANNEIGTIEPIKEIGLIAKEKNVIFHTDSVQAIGNIKIDVQELNIDALSMSAHKFYGPKGVGALYIKNGIKFEKIQDGGHQEKNKRAGTENVPGIVGMGKAIERIYDRFEEYNKKLIDLREYLLNSVEKNIKYTTINGDREKRLPGNANISFKFVQGEDLLLKLDFKGICASSGSACTSGSMEPSHVLMAIGCKHEDAQSALRITIGEENTKEDIDYLVENLVEIVEELRSISPQYKAFLEENNCEKSI